MSSGTSSGSGAAGAVYASSGTGSGAGGTGAAVFFSQGRGWVMGDSSSDGRRACGQRHSLSRTSIPSRADTDANHTTTPCATIGPTPSPKKEGSIDLLVMPPSLNDKLSLWPPRSVD